MLLKHSIFPGLDPQVSGVGEEKSKTSKTEPAPREWVRKAKPHFPGPIHVQICSHKTAIKSRRWSLFPPPYTFLENSSISSNDSYNVVLMVPC